MIADLHCAADPVHFARQRLLFSPDPVQARFLASWHPRRLLNCCRQWGKSTTVAALAVHRFVYGPPGNITLIFAPSLRQSAELLRKMIRFVVTLGFTPRGDGHNERSLMSIHGSRIVALPSSDNRTIGFSAVNLLIFDEAARVDDAVYASARPMIATTGGDILALSTPRFRRGFFYDAWTHGGDTWERYSVPAADCPRIPTAFLEEERRAQSEHEFRRLYCCDFVPVGRTAFSPAALGNALADDSDPV